MFKEQILNPVLDNIRRNPDLNSFCIDGRYYTYYEFGNYIGKIRSLITQRIIKNNNVGLVTNNDIETYASIFALWLEGYCYVPLHVKQPLDRCHNIIEQVGIDTILDSSKKSRYDDSLVINTSVETEDISQLIIKESISDDTLAYILFTSGSTGTPKGVTLTRGNIGAFVESFWATGIQLGINDRCLQCFDLTFDVSVQCYLVGLISGACVYTVPYGEGKYLYVAGLIDEYKLTFAAMAPSMLRFMEPFFDQIDMSSLRSCILTAEACPRKLLETAYEKCPNVELYDFYGPTEATIYCTYYKLSRESNNKELNGIISIGKPLKNCIGLILDENGNELPVGEKGELCIAGQQVTPGYWNNAEKNNTSFFYRNISSQQVRFYHTGDLCFMDSDGDIMYSGRMDNQVKVQGFRVELGEIEYHAREATGKNAVCIAGEEKGNVMLCLVVEGEPSDTKGLVTYMKSKMPHYMIPGTISFMEHFPLNSNDKVDRKQIKSLLGV